MDEEYVEGCRTVNWILKSALILAFWTKYFVRSELACLMTDQVCLASGFGEAMECIRVELDAPIYLTRACRS